jgi:PBP1b-binding outer membrane lipoprotein LpoB
MKKFKHITVILLSIVVFFSCSKDKVTNTLPDPNCTDTVSFNATVLPIIQQNCVSCHDVGNSTGYTFSNHTNISNQSSAILGSMQGQGYSMMPQGGPALPDSTIQFIKCWVSQGKLNN